MISVVLLRVVAYGESSGSKKHGGDGSVSKKTDRQEMCPLHLNLCC